MSNGFIDPKERHAMAKEGMEFELLAPAGFEWDVEKSRRNVADRGIDFDDAKEVFYGPVILRRSDRNNEERWLAVGFWENRLIAVVFTRRADVIRIISARRARKNEEREYRNAQMGRPSEGQD